MITCCYRHPDRETGIHCTRCGRSICPECMVPASVGHHCPACVEEAKPQTSQVRKPQWSTQTAAAAPITIGLIVVTALAFVYQESSFTEVTARFSDVPVLVRSGEYYRLITAAFLHVNLSHLLLNMLGLWIIGSQVERVLGPMKYLALYLVAGVGGSVAYNVMGSPIGSAIGASTAVFGLFGAAFVIAHFRGGDTRTIITLIVINLVFGLAVPGIDNWGHLGGLATGFVVAGVYELSERLPSAQRAAAQMAGVAAVLVGLAVVLNAAAPT